jgi:hypothetical protein
MRSIKDISKDYDNIKLKIGGWYKIISMGNIWLVQIYNFSDNYLTHIGDCYIIEDGLIVKIFSSYCMDVGGVKYNGWG